VLAFFDDVTKFKNIVTFVECSNIGFRAGPRHRPGVRRPRAHAVRGP